MSDQTRERPRSQVISPPPPSIWAEIIERLRFRGKIVKSAIFENDGAVLASTPGFGFLRDEDFIAIKSAMKDSKNYMFCLEIQRVAYKCLKVNSSTVIGRRESSLFLAHLCFGNSRILIGYSDIKYPGSCIEEMTVLQEEFACREEMNFALKNASKDLKSVIM